jgi:thiamine-phosphate pyrophosphorylase
VKLRGLYAVTPDCPDSATLLAKAETALRGGLALLQYRNKSASSERAASEAQALRVLAARYRTPFIVNDDVELARALDADGVHLGRDDGDVGKARVRLPGKLLGVSCYDSLARAEAAAAAGADYVAFGSVFASSTKPGAVRAPLSLFGAARRLGVPLCAIGGVTVDNVPRLIEAGADLAAVISDLFDAPDIAARARAYAKIFG